MMVKPFEEAVFKQKQGELSGLVQSDFGFHIIKVTGIKEGKQKKLDEVRAEIEGELKRQGHKALRGSRRGLHQHGL